THRRHDADRGRGASARLPRAGPALCRTRLWCGEHLQVLPCRFRPPPFLPGRGKDAVDSQVCCPLQLPIHAIIFHSPPQSAYLHPQRYFANPNAMTITLTFPDGSKREFNQGVTGAEVARSISEGLARNALAIEVDGEVWDLSRPITADASIKILTWNDRGGKAAFWHSSAHLMAEALEALYPGVKFGIGPPIENGFYYDIDLDGRQFGEEDLAAVEKKMAELAKQASTFERRNVSKAEALEYFKAKGDPYKIELINDLEDGTITFYQQGNFVDLCRGPHIPNTGFIKAIKLLNVAGAYWRGDEKNKMLTRIYGITFPKNKELEEYLRVLEEAKKRDHRKLGKELELFA